MPSTASRGSLVRVHRCHSRASTLRLLRSTLRLLRSTLRFLRSIFDGCRQLRADAVVYEQMPSTTSRGSPLQLQPQALDPPFVALDPSSTDAVDYERMPSCYPRRPHTNSPLPVRILVLLGSICPGQSAMLLAMAEPSSNQSSRNEESSVPPPLDRHVAYHSSCWSS